jgi:lipoate-protein ligase A
VAGSVGDLHALDPGLDGTPRRQVLVMRPDRPALVLGSTQPDGDADHEAAGRLGIDVVRRRSGGAAVLVEPDALVWVDVVVPRDDPLWDDDVGRASHWLGEAWAEAIAALSGGGDGAGAGTGAALVHRGGMQRSELSPVVCFAGLGPGEVTLEGRKVVGLSQRRTRALARFQTSVPLRWDAARHAELLGPGLRRALGQVGADRERTEGLDVLAALRALPVAGLGSIGGDAVADALVDALRRR